jgi:hypothetical protein
LYHHSTWTSVFAWGLVLFVALVLFISATTVSSSEAPKKPGKLNRLAQAVGLNKKVSRVNRTCLGLADVSKSVQVNKGDAMDMKGRATWFSKGNWNLWLGFVRELHIRLQFVQRCFLHGTYVLEIDPANAYFAKLLKSNERIRQARMFNNVPGRGCLWSSCSVASLFVPG